MSVAEQEKTSTNGGGAANAALKAAAAAAAAGAATDAVRRIPSHDAGNSDGDDRGEGGSSTRGSKGGSSPSILAPAAATSWEAAADALLPMADDAAQAAGKYVASHGPEVVRDRIVPKFIAGFNDAN